MSKLQDADLEIKDLEKTSKKVYKEISEHGSMFDIYMKNKWEQEHENKVIEHVAKVKSLIEEFETS